MKAIARYILTVHDDGSIATKPYMPNSRRDAKTGRFIKTVRAEVDDTPMLFPELNTPKEANDELSA